MTGNITASTLLFFNPPVIQKQEGKTSLATPENKFLTAAIQQIMIDFFEEIDPIISEIENTMGKLAMTEDEDSLINSPQKNNNAPENTTNKLRLLYLKNILYSRPKDKLFYSKKEVRGFDEIIDVYQEIIPLIRKAKTIIEKFKNEYFALLDEQNKEVVLQLERDIVFLEKAFAYAQIINPVCYSAEDKTLLVDTRSDPSAIISALAALYDEGLIAREIDIKRQEKNEETATAIISSIPFPFNINSDSKTTLEMLNRRDRVYYYNPILKNRHNIEKHLAQLIDQAKLQYKTYISLDALLPEFSLTVKGEANVQEAIIRKRTLDHLDATYLIKGQYKRPPYTLAPNEGIFYYPIKPIDH